MTRNRVIVCVLTLGVVASFVDVSLFAGEIEDPPVCGFFVTPDEIGPPPAISGGPLIPLNYSTGFEPEEGFVVGDTGPIFNPNHAGYIDLQPTGVCGGTPASPCWGTTTAANRSLRQGHVSNLHPASGVQHLRLSFDPNTRVAQPSFGLGIDARYPRTADLSPRPIAPTTVSADYSIVDWGYMNYRFQPQSSSQSLLQASVLFYYVTGLIYVADNRCGTEPLGWQQTGFAYNAAGNYVRLTIAADPCNNTINYYLGSLRFYSGCIIAGTTLEQLVVFGDNLPGSHMDIDNVRFETGPVCGCGNNVIDQGEQCDFNDDSSCPGRCDHQSCQCTPICTLADPCVLTNGDNGPFVPPCDPTYGCIFRYDGTGVPAVSIDTCGSSFDTNIAFWGSENDFDDIGAANNDCCDPSDPNCGESGQGTDPSASCYNNSPGGESCACHSLPGFPADTQWIGQVLAAGNSLPPVGASIRIHIDKKATCGGDRIGSCCDTNGPGAGTCTDNVTEAMCQGTDKFWTENVGCEAVYCICVPDCTGRVCGTDGCAGSCGPPCSDGNVCNGVESCNAAGQCVPGAPMICDDGVFCNGSESCDPQAGCLTGAPPCDDGDECDEEADACIPSAIPTVSQWGLAILTLLLLTAAKIAFSRRRRYASSV